MAYDHNTGKLYHANYGYNEAGNGYVGRLLTYDLETGKPTCLLYTSPSPRDRV